jgi:hypothetical protein
MEIMWYRIVVSFCTVKAIIGAMRTGAIAMSQGPRCIRIHGLRRRKCATPSGRFNGHLFFKERK